MSPCPASVAKQVWCISIKSCELDIILYHQHLIYLHKCLKFSCSTIVQPTLWREGEARFMGTSSKKRKCAGVATNVYSRKTLERTKKGSMNFTCREGISTLRVRLKGRQPLIECAKSWLQYLSISPFYVFYFLGSTRALPLLLRILKCDEELRPT